eukprot:357255-Chlamydomonas_euryale.AAC.4
MSCGVWAGWGGWRARSVGSLGIWGRGRARWHGREHDGYEAWMYGAQGVWSGSAGGGICAWLLSTRCGTGATGSSEACPSEDGTCT